MKKGFIFQAQMLSPAILLAKAGWNSSIWEIYSLNSEGISGPREKNIQGHFLICTKI